MLKFKSRLKYFLIGFGIGIVFVIFLFGNRACSWLPENRVKNMIAEKEIFVGDSLRYLMDCQGVTNNDVYRLLNEDGDIDFTRSEAQQDPKLYLFQGYKNDKDITITYALYDSTAEVVNFEYGSKKCTTNLDNRSKSVVSLPDHEVIKIIESQTFRFLEKAECQIKCLKLTKAQIKIFHLSAITDMKRSEPRLEPNPYYWMNGKIGSKTYSIKYIIGDSRTRISEVILASKSCDCKD